MSKAEVERKSSLKPEVAARLEEIRLVMKEKTAMVRVAKELLTLADVNPNSGNIDGAAIGKKMMEFFEHLANVGGFCDTKTKKTIYALQHGLFASILLPNPITTAGQLKAIMGLAIGIQVDFTKRPFRTIGLTVKGFQAEVSTLLKR